jgi:hypothetical protein
MIADEIKPKPGARTGQPRVNAAKVAQATNLTFHRDGSRKAEAAQ